MASPFVLLEHLHQGHAFTLERARDERDGSLVVLKRLAPERSSPGEQSRLRREYEILRSLDLPGVAATRGLIEEGASLTLVLRDFGGVNLASWLQATPRSLLARLDVAIRLAAIVGALHEHGVIHKDIKPRNILVDPTGQVQLIDLGIATRVPRELPALRSPTVLEGTLAYIAPEQTGRMNRPIDHRSDLYSLGATLYEVMVGRPPFAGDPLELVHAHIARAPVPPATQDPAIPQALSDIVLKLLAKPAEDRYRSAFGLKADLERCRDAIAGGLSLATFPLGQDDPAPGFEVPARLFGREAAVAALVAAHARVRAGACELALLTGAAGVGKTAVIRELHHELGSGVCVSGKFDQLRRDQPYSAVREALAQLVDGALAASEEGLARIRWELERALGKHTGPLLDLLPGAAALLGPRGAAEPAGITGITPAAARSRTHRALLGFVRAFSGPRSTLVLELDDLQWADAASLELLSALLADVKTRGLLVIASYRDAEVGPEHPLRRTLAAVQASGCPITELTIGPLDGDAVAALCAATLARPVDDPDLRALAAVVHDRGGGVPLLCGEFLRDLHRHGLLRFSSEGRGFVWALPQVVAAATSADVVARMVERTRELDDDARSVLHLAACLGGSFTADTLAALAERPSAAIATALAAATAAGFLVVIAGRHHFFHDRVQQAVLSTLEPLARARHHLAIARHLRARPDVVGDEAFEVADHYNLALPLIEQADERRALAALDLRAARRARAAGAFAAAAAYASAGLAALPSNADEHTLTHALRLLRAEGQFVTGDFAGAERGFAELLIDARDDRERATVYDQQVNLLVHLGKLKEAQALGLAGLRSLGLELRASPGVPTLLAEFLRTRAAIGRRSPEDLLALPPLQDEDLRQRLKLLYSISSAAFQIDFPLMIQIALRTTRMSLGGGNSALAAAEYISYGLMIGPITGDRKRMDAYGRVALTLLERYPDRGVEALVRFLYGNLIQPYCHPLRDSFAGLREAHQCGVDTGNLLYASLSLSSLATSMWHAGCAIDQVLAEIEGTVAFARRAKVATALRTIHAFHELVAWFADTPAPAPLGEFAEPNPDEARSMQHVAWRCAIERALHEGPGAEALALAELAETDAARVLMSTQLIQHHAHRALLLARDHQRRGVLGRLQAVRAIQSATRKLAVHAAENPENFSALHRLVEAELARVQGDQGLAMRRYEQAANAARDHGFVQQEALTCVTAARFYQDAGLADLARVYLLRARRAYQRWGAASRVAALDRAYPGLERSVAAASEVPANSAGSASGGTTIHSPLALDFASLFKATQVFAEEIELDRLLDKIMAIVVENAGAERGVLLLERGQGLVGARSYALADARSVDLGGAPLGRCPALPVALVHYVQRTGKAVAVADLALDPRFLDDPQVRVARPRSALCTPLVHQGQRLGALYLENNLSAGVFDDQRLEALNVLAVQAAIAIEHALFYTRLDAARQAAEAANLAKTRFLANMSHELRTPLNAILGYSELLADEAATRGLGDMQDDCARIRQAGVHLLGLISDILDLTKIEADRLDIHSEPIVLASLLAELIHVFGPELARGKQRLVQEFGEDLGTMTGDPIRIRQVLLNLLGNAVKFGGDTITLRATRGPQCVRFVVADTGAGMSAEQLAAIFEPFTQIDASVTRRRDGAGLGLAICRSLCERMGGTIAVTSAPAAGTSFTVELPLRPPDARD